MAKKKPLTDQERVVAGDFVQQVDGLIVIMGELERVQHDSPVRDELLQRLHESFDDADLTALAHILSDAADPDVRCPQ